MFLEGRNMVKKSISLICALLVSGISVGYAATLTSDAPIDRIQFSKENFEQFDETAKRSETAVVGKDNIRIEICQIAGKQVLIVHCKDDIRLFSQNEIGEVFEMKDQYTGIKKFMHQILLGTRNVVGLGCVGVGGVAIIQLATGGRSWFIQ